MSFEAKKIFLVTYILSKRGITSQDLARCIYSVRKDKFFPLMVVFNKYTFFGTIGENYITQVCSSDNPQKLLDSFDPVSSFCLNRLSKKDSLLVQKLFWQEIQSFSVFFENYILFDLPLTIENIEFFKKDKNPKIYRYKRQIEINGKVFEITDILNKRKGKFLEKEYRLEKEILFAKERKLNHEERNK